MSFVIYACSILSVTSALGWYVDTHLARTLPPSNIHARGMSWISATYWRPLILAFRTIYSEERPFPARAVVVNHFGLNTFHTRTCRLWESKHLNSPYNTSRFNFQFWDVLCFFSSSSGNPELMLMHQTTPDRSGWPYGILRGVMALLFFIPYELSIPMRLAPKQNRRRVHKSRYRV